MPSTAKRNGVAVEGADEVHIDDAVEDNVAAGDIGRDGALIEPSQGVVDLVNDSELAANEDSRGDGKFGAAEINLAILNTTRNLIVWRTPHDLAVTAEA